MGRGGWFCSGGPARTLLRHGDSDEGRGAAGNDDGLREQVDARFARPGTRRVLAAGRDHDDGYAPPVERSIECITVQELRREPEETMTTAEHKPGGRTPSLKAMSHPGSPEQ